MRICWYTKANALTRQRLQILWHDPLNMTWCRATSVGHSDPEPHLASYYCCSLSNFASESQQTRHDRGEPRWLSTLGRWAVIEKISSTDKTRLEGVVTGVFHLILRQTIRWNPPQFCTKREKGWFVLTLSLAIKGKEKKKSEACKTNIVRLKGENDKKINK